VSSIPNGPEPAPAIFSENLGAAVEVQGTFWWRILGALTIAASSVMGAAVWRIEHYVSRMELARVFAMAMTPTRPPGAGPSVQVRVPPPPPRPRPKPPRKAIPWRPKDEGIPFSINPSEWVHPDAPPTPESKPELPPPARVERVQEPPVNGPTADPTALAAASQRQTVVSEITRQTWALLSYVILECVALAGFSAILLLVGAGLTVSGAYVLGRWAGYAELTRQDYLRIVACSGGYAVILAFALMLPSSRCRSRALRLRRLDARQSWLGRPVACGLFYVGVALISGAVALTRVHLLQLPLWEEALHLRLLPQRVLLGWCALAALLGLSVCIGRRWLMWTAYVFCLLGVALHLICWGLPFALTGPPGVLKILPALIGLLLIALGRIRDCLDARAIGHGAA
jgi:hypothetical protein